MNDLVDLLTNVDAGRESRLRQGKVVSISAGPPRTVTITVNGVNYSGVRIMDHVRVVVDEGVFFIDAGVGRWIIIGTNGSIGTDNIGFKVRRTTNEAVLATGNSRIITFDNIVDNRGFIPAGWTTGQTFTVPAGGQGVYIINATVMLGAAASAWGLGVRKNATGAALAATPSFAESNDRAMANGVAWLNDGDTLDCNFLNLSGGNVTITATGGDGTSTQTPMLSVYRA